MTHKISLRISEVRKMAGLSQSELAQRMGVSSSLICHWENGTRNPSPQQVLEVSQNLGVAVDYLLNSEVRPVFKLTDIQIDHLAELYKK